MMRKKKNWMKRLNFKIIGGFLLLLLLVFSLGLLLFTLHILMKNKNLNLEIN